MWKTFIQLMLAAVLLAFPASANANMLIVPYFGFAPASDFVRTAVMSEKNNDLSTEVEKQCLAIALYHEARGEPLIGQIAVGETILNRVRSTAYPDTICEVVYQNAHRLNRCQFSFACDRIDDYPKNREAYLKSINLSNALVLKQVNLLGDMRSDFFNSKADNMTHYHRFDVSPTWSKNMEKLAQIGHHVFFRSERVVKRYRSQVN